MTNFVRSVIVPVRFCCSKIKGMRRTVFLVFALTFAQSLFISPEDMTEIVVSNQEMSLPDFISSMFSSVPSSVRTEEKQDNKVKTLEMRVAHLEKNFVAFGTVFHQCQLLMLWCLFLLSMAFGCFGCKSRRNTSRSQHVLVEPTITPIITKSLQEK